MQYQACPRVPPVAGDDVPVVFLGDEDVAGVEVVDLWQEHQVRGMPFVQRDDLLPRGHGERGPGGEYMLALGGAAEPVGRQAAVTAIVNVGMGQEEVDRSVRELM